MSVLPKDIRNALRRSRGEALVGRKSNDAAAVKRAEYARLSLPPPANRCPACSHNLKLWLKTYGYTLGLVLLLSACAYRPMIDPKGSTTPENYYQDLAECEQLAEIAAPMTTEVLVQSLIGAGIGAAVAFVAHEYTSPGVPQGTAVAVGAGAGAGMGIFTGVGTAVDDQQRLTRKCLEGRGYVVIE